MNKRLFVCRLIALTILFSLLVGCIAKNDEQNGRIDDVSDSAFYHSEGIDENGFWEGIRALDYVDIDKYKSLPIPSNVHQISNEIIQNEVADIIAYYSPTTQIYNRPVIDGDTVVSVKYSDT